MSKAEEGVSSFTVREPETSCPTHLLFHDSEEDDMTLGEMSRGGDSASVAGAGPGNAGKVDEDGNPIGDDESDEKDELIAYLQRQLEEATTEGARKEKALQQSKKTLSAALLEKAQALAKFDRVDTECQQLKASLAACEATLAQMNKRVEELARNQRPPVVETAVVVAPAPKSSVCVIS